MNLNFGQDSYPSILKVASNLWSLKKTLQSLQWSVINSMLIITIGIRAVVQWQVLFLHVWVLRFNPQYCNTTTSTTTAAATAAAATTTTNNNNNNDDDKSNLQKGLAHGSRSSPWLGKKGSRIGASGYIVSALGRRQGVNECAQLTLSSYMIQGPSPGNGAPHSGWVFPPHHTQSQAYPEALSQVMLELIRLMTEIDPHCQSSQTFLP